MVFTVLCPNGLCLNINPLILPNNPGLWTTVVVVVPTGLNGGRLVLLTTVVLGAIGRPTARLRPTPK